jgi:hypothetical protein
MRVIVLALTILLFFFYLTSNATQGFVSVNTTSNGTGITGFDQNDSIRNMTNPVFKMERNPLANLSNPLENLSNPLENLTKN